MAFRACPEGRARGDFAQAGNLEFDAGIIRDVIFTKDKARLAKANRTTEAAVATMRTSMCLVSTTLTVLTWSERWPASENQLWLACGAAFAV